MAMGEPYRRIFSVLIYLHENKRMAEGFYYLLIHIVLFVTRSLCVIHHVLDTNSLCIFLRPLFEDRRLVACH